jgi:hypothetical protein
MMESVLIPIPSKEKEWDSALCGTVPACWGKTGDSTQLSIGNGCELRY